MNETPEPIIPCSHIEKNLRHALCGVTYLTIAYIITRNMVFSDAVIEILRLGLHFLKQKTALENRRGQTYIPDAGNSIGVNGFKTTTQHTY